ncbi:STM4014 family protein [Janthinobacterium sp. GW460P]|uniref:STM4014 family protein n=1 Tax=unclassified Janthinobacterium TaxID=2610881 RepID=UPI00111C21FB|nr:MULTISPECIES: STM4014 family protein [unclassified Janthinobacterium]MCC7705259.1 STM4014 family protein [Janthinobacterium sp. GW460P]MCC7710646.1 STM4014 family protein [Janthinobacterium sp. GW460W]
MATALTLLATQGSKRVRLMQAARAQLRLPPAQVLEWRDWLARPDLLPAALRQLGWLKIEPPGDDPGAHLLLLQAGCRLLDRAPMRAPEHGELLAMDAWFAGFSAAMASLAAQLADLPQVRVVNAPDEISRMTDKLACQRHLAAHGVPVPFLLGPVHDYAHMQELLRQHGLDRLYLKPRYGSSASGVVAYRRNKAGRQQATTSAVLQHGDGAARLMNSKRMARYETQHDIAALVDALAAQQLYAEAWLNKPRCGDSHYDLRVVTLAGQPAHRVARIGQHMMTNLHLDNRRGDAASLLNEADLAALEETAALAARAFPASHVTGYDLVVRHGQAHVLEANAFGDLLPGLLWQGVDTYTAQLAHA